MIPVRKHLIRLKRSSVTGRWQAQLPECDVYKSPQHRVRHGFQFTFFRELNGTDPEDQRNREIDIMGKRLFAC